VPVFKWGAGAFNFENKIIFKYGILREKEMYFGKIILTEKTFKI